MENSKSPVMVSWDSAGIYKLVIKKPFPTVAFCSAARFHMLTGIKDTIGEKHPNEYLIDQGTLKELLYMISGLWPEL